MFMPSFNDAMVPMEEMCLFHLISSSKAWKDYFVMQTIITQIDVIRFGVFLKRKTANITGIKFD